jgi:integrase
MNSAQYLTKRKSTGIYYVGERLPDKRVKWTSTRCTRKIDALVFQKSYTPKPPAVNVPKLLDFFSNTLRSRVQGLIRKSTLDQYALTLAQFTALVSDKTLDAYTLTDLDKYRDVRLAKNRPVTFNIEQRQIKSVFAKAHRWGLVKENVFAKVPQLKVPRNLPLYMSKEEFTLLHEHVQNQTMKDIFLWSVMTGCRISETLQIKWSDIDLASSSIRIRNSETFATKTGLERIIPINSTLLTMLIRRNKDNAGRYELVFHRRGYKLERNSVTRIYKRAVRALGLDDKYKLHGLRHAFASWGVQAGVSIFAMSKLLGHACSVSEH